MKTESTHSQSPTQEIITVEQLAKRLQVSRATLFTWMQKGIFSQGRHYFKQGRVLRFIWSTDLIQELLIGSDKKLEKTPSVGASLISVQRKKSQAMNWEY